ncbi:MAG: outer membrane beta-barrel protein [Bacteroidaceae bacterium]|nr:outer membrane beta-barrel protein [Bacteroidaceae bacterium]
MNRRITLFVLALLLTVGAQAQKRITCEYNNVSLSDALSQLCEQQNDYNIMFLYNELEDFRITTTINGKSLPDAIQHMIGFYPIRIVVDTSNPEEKKIFVECTHKTDRHLTGTIIDEQDQPVAYANVAILNPADSTLLGGGVSNESGYFAVPYEQDAVLVRISYVGYKTVYLFCDIEKVGTIQLFPETQVLKDVTVKGQRLLYTSTDRGLQVSVQGTPLEQFGSVSEMLSHLPLMMSNGEIAGHGKPEFYINNKKVRGEDELERLRADEVKSVEIITQLGTEYDATVSSVIRIKTIRRTGEGLSGSFSNAYRQGHEHYENANASLNYRLQNGMDFFARGYLTDNNTRTTSTTNVQLQASSVWNYLKDKEYGNHMKYYFADLGWNWEINDHHSVGFTYTANNYIGNRKYISSSDEQTWQDGIMVDGGHSTTTTLTKPKLTHSANAYYVGEIGKWKVDFSADYYNAHSLSEMNGGTDGETPVSSNTATKNQLVAEKMVVTAPMPVGDLTFGEEASAVDRTSDFTQSGFSADNHIQQQTTTWSAFANYALKLGSISFNAGLRWQNEHNRYDLNGVRNDEMSPNYHVLIPRATITYQKSPWTHSLSYQCARYNPPYSILSSAVTYTSKYEYQSGNPFLQPQTSHSFVWKSQWKWIHAEAIYRCQKNVYHSMASAYDDVNHPGVILTDFRTVPKTQYYMIVLNLTPKIGIWQMNYTAEFSVEDLDYGELGIAYNWHGLMTDFTLDNTFTLPHAWMLNVTGSITPYQKSAYWINKTTGSLDLRLSKQFLRDKSLNVALVASDLLHTKYKEGTAYGGLGYRNTYRLYSDTRRIGFNVSWRFNATKSRYKGSHAGQSERNRL